MSRYEYSELEIAYRALQAYRPRRNRWAEHPDDPATPPRLRGLIRKRPIFTAKPRRQRGPSRPLPTYNTYTEDKMPFSVTRPLKVQELLKNNSPGLDAYKLADPDLPIEFELVTSASNLRDSDFEACFQLVEQTSSNDYKGSSIGWKPKLKKEEMRNKDMLYLLIRMAGASENNDEPKEILGFLSFMFTNDDPPHEERDVVYIYEVHLADCLRGRGLGSMLIQFIEFAALECFFTKTMLTVFKVNEGARRLYSKLGYSKDACSPKDRKVRKRVIEADYIIMSKMLVDPF